MTRNRKSLASQAVLAISAETGNSERKHSDLNYEPNGDGNVDVNIFKVPAVLRTDIEYLAARYTAKLQTNTMNVELTGLATKAGLVSDTGSLVRTATGYSMDQPSIKLGPIVRTASRYSVGQYSTTLRNDDMDFQCRGLAVSTDIQPVSRTGTEYSSVYYSAESRISTESVIKRQARLQTPTDEVSERPKRVTWNC